MSDYASHTIQLNDDLGTPDSIKISPPTPGDCTFPSCEHVEQAKQEWEYTADALPELVCLLDDAGSIVRANRSVERWGLGSVSGARGLALHDLLHPDCATPDCYLKRFADDTSRQIRGEQQESQCQALDPVLKRYLDIRLLSPASGYSAATMQHKHHAVVVIADITELKAAEEGLQQLTQDLEQRVALRTRQLAETNRKLRQEMLDRHMAQQELQHSRDSYKLLVESMNEGLVVRDTADRITYVNGCMARMLGYSPEELLGQPVLNFLGETDPESWAARTHQRRLGDATPYNMTLKGRQGQTRWAKLSPKAILSADGEYAGSFAVVTDITDRVLAENALRISENELRELSALVLTAQETERKRIASELHDGIGQTLSAIKFLIENIIGQVHMHVPEECLPKLQSLVPKLQGAIEEVRHTSMALRPSILDDLGILATLRWFAREYQASYVGIQVLLQLDADEADIPSEIKVVIFRIVQEACNNIAKHAGASRIEVGLRSGSAGLELQIEDDGVGFDVAATSNGHGPDKVGMGLISMRERAEYSGARFSLTSIEGDGTRILVAWPLPANPAASAA